MTLAVKYFDFRGEPFFRAGPPGSEAAAVPSCATRGRRPD